MNLPEQTAKELNEVFDRMEDSPAKVALAGLVVFINAASPKQVHTLATMLAEHAMRITTLRNVRKFADNIQGQNPSNG